MSAHRGSRSNKPSDWLLSAAASPSSPKEDKQDNRRRTAHGLRLSITHSERGDGSSSEEAVTNLFDPTVSSVRFNLRDPSMPPAHLPPLDTIDTCSVDMSEITEAPTTFSDNNYKNGSSSTNFRNINPIFRDPAPNPSSNRSLGMAGTEEIPDRSVPLNRDSEGVVGTISHGSRKSADRTTESTSPGSSEPKEGPQNATEMSMPRQSSISTKIVSFPDEGELEPTKPLRRICFPFKKKSNLKKSNPDSREPPNAHDHADAAHMGEDKRVDFYHMNFRRHGEQAKTTEIQYNQGLTSIPLEKEELVVTQMEDMATKELVWLLEYADSERKKEDLVKKTANRYSFRSRGGEFASYTLSEDTFSFLISAPIMSTPFWTGIFLTVLKTGIFALIAYGSFSFRDETNILGIPAAVTWPMAIAQCLANFVACITQDDVITALHRFFEGYSDDLAQSFVGASFSKWLASIIFESLEGLFGLIVTFILIVKSADIVELLLNFTAVEFVAQVDNVGFALANQGYLGAVNKAETNIVMETEYKVSKAQQANPFFQMLTLFAVFLSLQAGWMFFYVNQQRGFYIQQALYIQFDDGVNPGLPLYSGLYYLSMNDGFIFEDAHSRFLYKRDSGPGTIGYCSGLKSWTFSTIEDEDKYDPCSLDQVAAMSSGTIVFDVVETKDDVWFAAAAGSTRFFPFDFSLSVPCEDDAQCGGEGRGSCINNACECKAGFFGVRCDYEDSAMCEGIELREFDVSFSASREYSSSFKLLRSPARGSVISVYDHPVYFSSTAIENIALIDTVFYNGLRWIIVHFSSQFPIEPTEVIVRGALEQLIEGNRASFEQIFATFQGVHEFVSESVAFGTPEDATNPSPVGLSWYRAQGDGLNDLSVVGSTEAAFLCSVCDGLLNPCFNDGICGADGVCSCTHGASGRLCQNTPIQNGFCDSFFNTPLFNYDGGDCCRLTCTSTDENSCGLIKVDEASKGIEYFYVGFPQCQDPQASCAEGDCWMSATSDLNIDPLKDSVLMQMSSNGRMVVTSQPPANIVRVFDQVDAHWEQRGPLLEGMRTGVFGRYFYLLSLPGEVLSRRVGQVPLLLAVAFEGYDNTTSLPIYVWYSDAIDWELWRQIPLCNETCDIRDVQLGSGDTETSALVCFMDGTCKVFEENWEDDGIVSFDSPGQASISGLRPYLVVTKQSLVTLYDMERKSNGFYEIIDSFDMKDSWESTRDLQLDNLNFVTAKLSSEGRSIGLAGEFTSNQDGNHTITQYIVALLGIEYEDQYLYTRGMTVVPFPGASPGTTEVYEFDFADDALTVLIKYASSSETKLTAFTFHTNRGFIQNGNSVSVSETSGISLAETGPTIAISDEGHLEFLTLPQKCGSNESTVGVSIALDDHPASVSWSIESVKTFLGQKFNGIVLEECTNCYTPELVYNRMRIAQEICIPRSLSDCFELTFQSNNPDSDDYGLVLFLDGEEVDRFTDPQVGEVHSFVASNGTSERCRVDRVECDSGFVDLGIVVKLDEFPYETSWFLADLSGNIEMRVGEYDNEFAIEVGQTCVSVDECKIFVVLDDWGDGIWNGFYNIFVDGELFMNKTGGFASGSLHLVGSSCDGVEFGCLAQPALSRGGDVLKNTSVSVLTTNPGAPLVNVEGCEVQDLSCNSTESLVTIGIKFDSILRVYWTLGSVSFGEPYLVSPSYSFPSSTIIHQQCLPSEDCLVFVIGNVLAAGLGQTGRYSVAVDDDVLVSRSGNFAAGEMITIGTNCPAVVNVTIELSSLLTSVRFRGWSIVDSGGSEVYSVVPWAYFPIVSADQDDSVSSTIQLLSKTTYSIHVLDNLDTTVAVYLNSSGATELLAEEFYEGFLAVTPALNFTTP